MSVVDPPDVGDRVIGLAPPVVRPTLATRRTHVRLSVLAALLTVLFAGQATLVLSRVDDVARTIASTRLHERPITDSGSGSSSGSSSGSGSGSQTVPDDGTKDVQAVLDARGQALMRGDLAGWLEPLSTIATPALRKQQSDLFGRLRLLPLQSYASTVQYSDELIGDDAVGSPEGRTVGIRLAFRLAGQSADVWRTQKLVFIPQDGRWRLHRDDTDVQQKDLWDFESIRVVTGPRSIVIGSVAEARRLKSYAAETDRAAKKIDGILGRTWPRKSVVLVPGTVDRVQELTGMTRAETESFWALTFDTALTGRGWISGDDAPAGFWVLINPEAAHAGDAWDRRIVLAHELTHVATGYLARTEPPVWVEEGYADELAYRGEGLTRRDMTPTLTKAVRSGKWNGRLPVDADFHSTDGKVQSLAYEAAWTVYDFVEREYGAKAMDRFHATMTGMTPDRSVRPANQKAAPDPAALTYTLAHLFKTDPKTFQKKWAASVRTL